MGLKEEIDKAIGAHGMWKARLRSSIDTGKTEVPVATIMMDNQCEFGKWLHGTTITSAEKVSADYKQVKDLHTTFHTLAAKVAELATTGKKTEAEKMMAQGGEYAKTTSALTAAMMGWKQKSQ